MFVFCSDSSAENSNISAVASASVSDSGTEEPLDPFFGLNKNDLFKIAESFVLLIFAMIFLILIISIYGNVTFLVLSGSTLKSPAGIIAYLEYLF